MKLPCKVIEDLLPIYHDGVCSEESRAIVDEHLQECEACRDILSQIDEDLNVKVTVDEKKAFEKLKTNWNRMKKKVLIKGIAIALVVITLLIVGYVGQSELRIIPVPIEKIQISDVSQLENGLVAFHLYITDGKPLYRLSTTVDRETGSVYITPKRALLEIGWYPEGMTLASNRYYYAAFTGLYDAELVGLEYYFDSDIERMYVGTPKNSILIYERGMELPPASDEAETEYARYLNSHND